MASNRFYYTIAVFMTVILLISCMKTLPTPGFAVDDEAEKIAADAGFSPEIAIILQKAAHDGIRRMRTADDNGTVIPVNGIESPVTVEHFEKCLKKIQKKTVGMNVLVFRSERNFGIKPDMVAVIKSTDQFDILRIRQTNGFTDSVSTVTIIETLQRWHNRSPFVITGAGIDWVELEFVALPADLITFAREVYALCPDVLSQGSGSIEALAEEIGRTNTLFLWWENPPYKTDPH